MPLVDRPRARVARVYKSTKRVGALLLGALCLFNAASAAGQQLWSATLTVDHGALGNFNYAGCIDNIDVLTDCSSALSDNDFVHGDTTFTVFSVYYVLESRRLFFSAYNPLSALKAKGRLVLDDGEASVSVSFADAVYVNALVNGTAITDSQAHWDPPATSGLAWDNGESVTITLELVEEKHAAEDALPELARAELSGALDVIGRRFDAPRGEKSALTIAGHRVGGARPEFGTLDARGRDGLRREAPVHDATPDAEALLQGSAFALSSGGGGADGGPGLTVWGRGALRHFEGGSGEGAWRGKARSAWLGADARAGSGLLAGLAERTHVV